MSARVLRLGMAEMRNIINYDNAIGELTTNNTSTPPDSTDLNRVRRNLFGPVDHEENRRFLERELAAQQTGASDRWGFDFNRGTPRSSGLGTARYSWEKVTEAVPEPYALLRMTALQKIAVDDETVELEATTASTAAGVAEDRDEVEEQGVAKQRQPRIKEFMQLQKRKPFPNGAKTDPAVEQSSSRAKKARSSS